MRPFLSSLRANLFFTLRARDLAPPSQNPVDAPASGPFSADKTRPVPLLFDMKLAISLVAMSIVLGGALGATDKCLTSCTQIKVSGFGIANRIYRLLDGVYTPKENTNVNEKPTRYVQEISDTTTYEIFFDEKESKYKVEVIVGEITNLMIESQQAEYVCLEDAGFTDYIFEVTFGSTPPFSLTTECLSTPTTTTSPCKPCRQVTDADKTLNGYYELKASGDSRCTIDGCLYNKHQTEDMYCLLSRRKVHSHGSLPPLIFMISFTLHMWCCLKMFGSYTEVIHIFISIRFLYS